MTQQPPDFSNLQFVTVKEMAEELRLSPMTIYRLVQAGEIPAYRVGRSFRVTTAAFKAYKERSKVR